MLKERTEDEQALCYVADHQEVKNSTLAFSVIMTPYFSEENKKVYRRKQKSMSQLVSLIHKQAFKFILTESLSVLLSVRFKGGLSEYKA